MGLVVQFQESGGVRDSLYVVRNTWHQDLGLIDGLGRAFRYVPHREEPVWVGSGTVLSGAQRILGVSGPCRLLEVTDPLLPSASGAAPLAAPRPAPCPSGDSPVALAIRGPGDGLPQSR